ncbi:MAG TPA: phytanoyl-CoA dioxygenase family protein [Pyrinomonadaceae bacterium]|nr:phytanoyl-CoA dioxygenase family protein [Pyrinomonadaceae bacterium]
MDSSLSAEQIKKYERDGFVHPLRIMSADEARKFRAGFEEFEALLGRKLEYAAMTHLFFRWAFDLSSQRKILNAVQAILGSDVLVQATLILCKHPADPSFVSWHQDYKYTSQETAPTVSAWVAISDSTRQSGCMRAIPGSHRDGIRPHKDTVIENNILTYSLEADESRAADIELKAGEMSLHQANIVHGSLPNHSDDKRIGFIIRFVTPQFQKTINPVVRVRGRDACEHLTLWPNTPTDDMKQTIGAWQEFVRERNLLR